MLKHLLCLSMTLASTVTAQSQIPIPAFGGTFASATATRGFYFQTPVAITITGVRVPDEAGIGVQCVEVIGMNGPAPIYPLTATGTQAFYARNVPSNTILTCSASFPAGAWIGVLGACGTTTMHNSYSGPIGGTFNTTIGGQPVALQQFLTQTNLNTAGGQPYSGNAQGLGQIGRIEVFYQTQTLGTGVNLPPFNNTNSAVAATRGFYFTTPVAIRIRGLRVPDETGNGVQNVEVKRLSGAPPTTPATTSGGEVFYAHNVPSLQIIPCNLLFAAGETIGILGACGTTTMRNSMGDPAGPFVTNIGGQPATLHRMFTASNLNSSQGQPYAAENGRIGRVEMYYELADGNASATPYGNGCEASRAFYESIPSGFDLMQRGLRLTPVNGVYRVDLLPSASAYIPPSWSGTPLQMTDDSERTVTLSSAFPHFGTPRTTLQVCSNGFVSVAPGNGLFGGGWLSSPVARWGTSHDFEPGGPLGGNVAFNETSVLSIFTWSNVPTWATAVRNTWQIQFNRATGEVTFVWLNMNPSADFLIGYAPGGQAHDKGSLDLSALPPTGYMTDLYDVASPSYLHGSLPVIGTTMPLWTNEIPAGSLFGVRILGYVADNTNLASFGAPTCHLHVQPIATDAFPISGASANLPLQIPSNLALIGLRVFGQAATYSPGLNPLDLMFTNGLDLLLDVQ